MNRSIDISYKTIVFTTAFFALLWVLFLIRDVIMLLFVAIIFMSAISPIVDRLEGWKVPKSLAISAVYIIVLVLVGLAISFVVTPVAIQTGNLITNLPHYSSQLLPENGFIDRGVIQQQLGSFSKNALEVSLAVFNNILAFISVAVLTFYLLLERQRLDDLIVQFSFGKQVKAMRIVNKAQEKLGAWLRGQIALSFIIGLAAYVLLSLLNIPYALPLAVLAGIMEVVPVIGPIVSAIPAILIAYISAPFSAIWVALGYFVIQQLENHLIVPQVMKYSVGLNPLVVILAVAIGGRLLGISGALLAVPITVVVQIIIEEILREEHV
jgi:predicted PurR-regulated permease PerM